MSRAAAASRKTLPPDGFEEPGGATELPLRMVANSVIDALFDLTVEATEGAIVNALGVT